MDGSRHVQLVEVFVAVFGDVVFAALEVVAEEEVEDLHRAFHVLGHDLDEAAGGGVHGGHPHHLGVVFAEALGAVDGELPALELLDDLGLLRVGVGEPRLVLAGDLIKGRLRDIDVALLNKRGAEGETAHSENGVSRSYEDGDIPPTLLRRILPMAGVIL